MVNQSISFGEEPYFLIAQLLHVYEIIDMLGLEIVVIDHQSINYQSLFHKVVHELIKPIVHVPSVGEIVLIYQIDKLQFLIFQFILIYSIQ